MLGHNFVTKYGTKQEILIIGKQAPVAIGAAIGAGGNAFFGYGVVKSARRAFGRAPDQWPVAKAPVMASIEGEVDDGLGQ